MMTNRSEHSCSMAGTTSESRKHVEMDEQSRFLCTCSPSYEAHNGSERAGHSQHGLTLGTRTMTMTP